MMLQLLSTNVACDPLLAAAAAALERALWLDIVLELQNCCNKKF